MFNQGNSDNTFQERILIITLKKHFPLTPEEETFEVLKASVCHSQSNMQFQVFK